MKQYSSKRSVQILANVLKQSGISHVIISPGSRNAPLAIHFSELGFSCYSIIDERSAAFVALGMAKSLHSPVAVVCTSGSAAANYYPAVVEAFYQNVPILLLTADRPENYVDIFDGQTIRQKNLYEQHSYGNFQTKEDFEENSDSYNFEIIKKAVDTCTENQGPVHINVPLSEPLYETTTELYYSTETEEIKLAQNYKISDKLLKEWNNSNKILILLGTLSPSSDLNFLLGKIAENENAVILSEVNSNQYHSKFFTNVDRYVFNFTDIDIQKFAPKLLITVGQNVVSKKVKEFLRKSNITKHWHVDKHWHPDTYFSLTDVIKENHKDFFDALVRNAKLKPSEYFELWEKHKELKDKKHYKYIENVEFSDFMVLRELSNVVPHEYCVHLSNSSAIRYAQLFNFSKNHEIYCNRGTSGIDGCTSTAMGFAIASANPVLLVTGDISFFYDINGLWNRYIPASTRIIILNNGEGNIFRILPIPSEMHALNDYIAVTHNHNTSDIAKHFNIEYNVAETEEEFFQIIEKFFSESLRPKMLEINTKKEENAKILKDYFLNLL